MENAIKMIPLCSVLCLATSTWADESPHAADGAGLRALAERAGIELGANSNAFPNGVSRYQADRAASAARELDLIERHFTIMTDANAIWPGASWKGPGDFRFDRADAFLEFCESRDVRTHGHGIGYACRIDWFTAMPAGTRSERGEVREVYEDHVRQTARHFAGTIDVWDICNEQLKVPYRAAGVRTKNNFVRAYERSPGRPRGRERVVPADLRDRSRGRPRRRAHPARF